MSVDRRPVQTFLTRVYNEACKGSGLSHRPNVILAQSDLFNALQTELQAVFYLRAPSLVTAPNLRSVCFKDVKVYKLDQTGWTVQLLRATTLKEATMSDRLLSGEEFHKEASGKIPYPSALFVRKDDALETKARIDDLNARLDASAPAEQAQCGASTGYTSGGAAGSGAYGSAGLAGPIGPSGDYAYNPAPTSDQAAARLLKSGLRGCLLEMQQQRSKLFALLGQQNSKIARLTNMLRDLGELV